MRLSPHFSHHEKGGGMKGCIFCKIVDKEIVSKIVYEDDDLIAFHDINPLAPVHILLVSKKHIENILGMTDEDAKLAAGLLFAANEIAKKFNIDKSGFRLIINCNSDGGQEVFHLHAHLIGGAPLGKMC